MRSKTRRRQLERLTCEERAVTLATLGSIGEPSVRNAIYRITLMTDDLYRFAHVAPLSSVPSTADARGPYIDRSVSV